MAHILVIEDNIGINNLITMNLNMVGHTYEEAYDGKEALILIKNNDFDIILLDVMLPYLDGFEIIRDTKLKNTPVIFITAKDSLADKIKGFNLGAVDYLVKPFEILELIARINVVLRSNIHEKIFILDNLTVKLNEHVVLLDNKEILLTTKEFDLLKVLIENKNIALSREKLIELVWGYDFTGETRTVDVHILNLRKKLNLEYRIKTVHKVGYRLEIDR